MFVLEVLLDWRGGIGLQRLPEEQLANRPSAVFVYLAEWSAGWWERERDAKTSAGPDKASLGI